MTHILVKMVAEDWTTVKIPRLMAESIDRFLELPIAKKNGMFSRADVITALVRKFLVEYENQYGIFVSRAAARTADDKDVSRPF